MVKRRTRKEIRAKKLSERQQEIVDYIGSHPDCTAMQVSDAIGIPRDSTAAILATLIKEQPGLLVRKSQPNPGTQPVFHYHKANGKDEASEPLRPRRKSAKRKTRTRPDLLLTLKVGRNDTVTMTVEDAADLLQQLLSLQRFFSED